MARRTFGRLWRLLLVCSRALMWLFSSPNPRRFANVRITYQAGGIRACLKRAVENFSDINRTYRPHANDLTPAQAGHILSLCRRKPLISIVVTVSQTTPAGLFRRCIASLARQHYGNWQAVLVLRGAQRPAVVAQITESCGLEPRRLSFCQVEPSAGPGTALNAGLRAARGEFVGFLDGADELSADALTWLARAVNRHPGASWFYSDEDSITRRGRHHSPNFKPDFSPEFLLSTMFTGRFAVYAAEFLRQQGPFTQRPDLDPHYDLALRLCEVLDASEIVHIRRVLYHRRRPRFAGRRYRSAPQDAQAQRNAIAQALERRGIRGRVTVCPDLAGVHEIVLEPRRFPKVSIVIPTRNSLESLVECLDSLRTHTSYRDYDVLVIDNRSDDPQVLEYLTDEQSAGRLRVIRYDKPFNHSDMNNTAVDCTGAEFVVFVNNDIKVLTDGWLEQMVATAELDDSVASVGALLLYPDRTVQHAGIILGIGGTAGHAHKYMKTGSGGYHGRLFALQEYSAVTAAFSLVRVSAFREVNGFNARRYPTSYNDVDLCIRLRARGYRCIYNPMVRAIHCESRTRPITTEEFVFKQRIAQDYRDILQSDPFYNPNLSLKNEQFAAFRAFAPEAEAPELLASAPERSRAGEDR